MRTTKGHRKELIIVIIPLHFYHFDQKSTKESGP